MNDEPLAIATKRRKKFADLYGTVTLAEREDGYFYMEQPDEDDPSQMGLIGFSRETATKLHALLGAWLASNS